MHIETERKFRVLSDEYKLQATESHRMTQGYIAHDAGRTVRVRISDDKAYLTIKGPSRNGLSRMEGVIDKTRYIVPAANGRKFEVDEFYGDNEGLVMAEIELESEDETFERPEWLGREVTGDKKYYNSHLLGYPYKQWSEK